ncbi:(Na+)-NQR maturation NqrM [Reinekea marina]|nr:(Na+)-NQR maturation NqrM [Reinekea marina]MDN3649716.1 (Na+)-NQR maturation NqrM [Reinekea marina]
MFIVVFAFMAMFVIVMAVGVIFGRKPIAGSCGGMAAIGMESECDVCGGDKTKCDKDDAFEGEVESSSAFYDASEPK